MLQLLHFLYSALVSVVIFIFSLFLRETPELICSLNFNLNLTAGVISLNKPFIKRIW